MIDQHELFLVDEVVWLLSKKTALPHYDFPVWDFFPSRHPYMLPGEIDVIARVGAVPNYPDLHAQLLESGMRLIHSPEQHAMCSELSGWYEKLKDLTPRSRVFAEFPSVADIEAEFSWPVFVKGSRQTSRHQRKLAIVQNPEQFSEVMELYKADSILHWQDLVVREYVPLRMVADDDREKIPCSFEFRCFFWRNMLVGFGQYWAEAKYEDSSLEAEEAIKVASEAAARVDVPFLVVDVGQTQQGNWIVIECNDGQESGYAGVSRMAVWQKIIEIERTK